MFIPPLCSIRLLPPYDYGFVEVGTFPTPTVEFTIKKRTFATLPTTLTNMIPGFYPSVNTFAPSSVTSTSNGIVISPITTTSTTFQITVSDGTASNSATVSISGIYPFFHGFSSLSVMTSIELASLTKVVEIKEDKFVDILGSDNFYFIYDFDYGTLSNIYDGVGNTCSASFSYTDSVFSSPTGLWAGKKFYVYKWASANVSAPIQNFEFRF